ncbi:hypothetical protein EBO15_38955 [Actinomadura harenae]|uniref:Uncharacterized protein n=1 Tax=Actinomadura harenae TaxID=2483351 RepID=A0A3M2LFM8_9ACTN|nr:hypothetical protein EBO15_38955 [Actinomadura harenae]
MVGCAEAAVTLLPMSPSSQDGFLGTIDGGLHLRQFPVDGARVDDPPVPVDPRCAFTASSKDSG